MKLKPLIISMSIASLLGSSPLLMAGKGQSSPHGSQAGYGNPSVVLKQLSAEEGDTLTFMREEEKLARDVYFTLHEQWGSPVFSSISRSEQRHMSSLKRMLDKYGLTDPVVDDSVGVFVNAELLELYWELVSAGEEGLREALHVGAFIEELDIKDLRNAIIASDHPDLIRVYENLLRGSRNHLRAFVGQIEGMGISYETQYLDQDEVNLIVDEPVERGGNPRRGRR